MPSPGYWREIPARYRLEGSRCGSCEAVAYPACRVCASCQSQDMKPATLSRRAKVITSTVIHVPPADFANEAPYAVAVVETPEGARLMVQVTDCDPGDVVPDLEVTLEFRLIRKEGHSGILCYGHKAIPCV